jgi:hypothetical protein
MLGDAKSRQERKAAHIAAALVALGISEKEAVRQAWAVKKDGKQLRPQSATAKKAAATRIKWPISWETPGTT